MNGICKLIIVLILGVVVWVLSPKIYAFFVYLYPTINYSDVNRGIFGDSFGSVTSLFSFLSFAAVIFAFYRTQDIDNEKTRPFIITNIDKNSVPGKFHAKNSAENITLEIRLKLKNYSEYLAHSVKIQSHIETKNEKYNCINTSIHYPITDSEVDSPNITLNTGKSECLTLLNSLTTSELVLLKIEIKYKNTTNKEFTTTNYYKLSITPSDFPAINELRQGVCEDKYWGGGKFVPIEIVEAENFIK